MENDESQKNSENIENKAKSEEEFNKKLQKNQFKIMTTFKKIKNLYSDDIIPLIKHHKRAVGDFLQNLMGDERDSRKIFNLKKRKMESDTQTSKSLNNKSHMSNNAQYLSNKIKIQIDKVRKKQDDITALNALFLNNKSFTDLEQRSHSNKRYNNNSLEKSEKGENYNEALRKKKLRNNFEIIANNYHQKLNDAFSKFNPKMNLNNLKMLIQISPTVRDDISKVKKEVDGDIKDITDKNRFHKQYQRILKKNAKNKSTKLLNPKIYKSDEIIQKSLTTKNQNQTSSINNMRRSSVILPKIKKSSSFLKNRDEMIKMEMLKKMMNKDTKKAMSLMDEQYGQITRLHNISQQINSYIENENISKKIDTQINDYKMYKFLESLKKRDQSKNPVYRPHDYFVYQNKKINELYNDLYINKLEARILDKEKKFHESLLSNRNGYFNKMTDDMKNSLKEFDYNISSNGINLEENQENNLDTL